MAWYWIALIIIICLALGGFAVLMLISRVMIEMGVTIFRGAKPKGDVRIDAFPKWVLIPALIIAAPVWAIRWIIAQASGRRVEAKMSIVNAKGHGYAPPWWAIPLILPLVILEDIKDWFRKGDPHDISGEPEKL